MAFSQLDRPVQFLKGVGPRRAESLARMGILTARDLLYHLPRRYDDASTVVPIGRLEVGMDTTALGRVRTKGVIPTRSGLRIFQAVLQDESGMITCAWPGQPWLERRIREGDLLLVTGPVRFFHGRQLQPREFTLLDREREELLEGAAEAGTIFVVYPASEEVPQWVLRRIFELNLEHLLPRAADDEYLEEAARERLGLVPLPDALGRLHRPDSLAAVEAGRRRLAFDELFFLQLVQALARHRRTLARPGIRFERNNRLIRPLHASLPYELTEAQTRCIRDIFDDMGSGRRMSRLLQGDVGSGKTVVALFAAALALESGWQAAVMAPTAILAEQHANRLRGMLAPFGVEVFLLTGQLGAAERREVLGRLAAGRPGLVVGTHALIQEGVEIPRLGLVIVDEQHRFGVRQRMALGDRDTDPDVLVMSATPIPRSLALTLYGDLDLSVVDQLPPGRPPVRTTLRRPASREDVLRFVDGQIEAGHRGYIVYPLVEDSEKVELASATSEHERLASEVFPNRRVALLHGQLPAEEKESVMRDFRDGRVDLLVATSVIEVGVDVPEATVMVVEHAERFGLSQLHQLRGRVGRGPAGGHCILIAEPGEAADERLRLFTSVDDGFEIARADLRIRGQGDLFGPLQHGRDPLLRFADLERDGSLLARARTMARGMVAADPELDDPRHARIRTVLTERYAERLEMYEVG